MTKRIADRKTAEELLRQLVSIPSPYFHEDEVMDFVLGWLQAAGLPAQLHTFYEGRETHFHGRNVHGCLDSGKPGPVIYLNGHLDTVQLCEGWTRPPYEGVVEDGRMYGVGALDMKGGDAAILLALQAFARDCLATAIVRLDAAGYDICFHVHDEIIAEAPADARWEDMAAVMSQQIDWAPGLLLPADGYSTVFYKKE